MKVILNDDEILASVPKFNNNSLNLEDNIMNSQYLTKYFLFIIFTHYNKCNNFIIQFILNKF